MFRVRKNFAANWGPGQVASGSQKSLRTVFSILGAHLAQCTRSASIWASGRARNPYFVILGASLLFDNRFLMHLMHGDLTGLKFHPFSPIFTHFHPFSPFSPSFSQHVL